MPSKCHSSEEDDFKEFVKQCDEQQDAVYNQQLEAVCFLLRDLKSKFDVQLCRSWLEVFAEADELQKFERNCLMALLFSQLKDTGRLQEPFTDMRKCNSRNLSQLTWEYKCRIEPLQEVTKTANKTSAGAESPELLVPQSSLADLRSNETADSQPTLIYMPYTVQQLDAKEVRYVREEQALWLSEFGVEKCEEHVSGSPRPRGQTTRPGRRGMIVKPHKHSFGPASEAQLAESAQHIATRKQLKRELVQPRRNDPASKSVRFFAEREKNRQKIREREQRDHMLRLQRQLEKKRKGAELEDKLQAERERLEQEKLQLEREREKQLRKVREQHEYERSLMAQRDGEQREHEEKWRRRQEKRQLWELNERLRRDCERKERQQRALELKKRKKTFYTEYLMGGKVDFTAYIEQCKSATASSKEQVNGKESASTQLVTNSSSSETVEMSTSDYRRLHQETYEMLKTEVEKRERQERERQAAEQAAHRAEQAANRAEHEEFLRLQFDQELCERLNHERKQRKVREREERFRLEYEQQKRERVEKERLKREREEFELRECERLEEFERLEREHSEIERLAHARQERKHEERERQDCHREEFEHRKHKLQGVERKKRELQEREYQKCAPQEQDRQKHEERELEYKELERKKAEIQERKRLKHRRLERERQEREQPECRRQEEHQGQLEIAGCEKQQYLCQEFQKQREAANLKSERLEQKQGEKKSEREKEAREKAGHEGAAEIEKRKKDKRDRKAQEKEQREREQATREKQGLEREKYLRELIKHEKLHKAAIERDERAMLQRVHEQRAIELKRQMQKDEKERMELIAKQEAPKTEKKKEARVNAECATQELERQNRETKKREERERRQLLAKEECQNAEREKQECARRQSTQEERAKQSLDEKKREIKEHEERERKAQYERELDIRKFNLEVQIRREKRALKKYERLVKEQAKYLADEQKQQSILEQKAAGEPLSDALEEKQQTESSKELKPEVNGETKQPQGEQKKEKAKAVEAEQKLGRKSMRSSDHRIHSKERDEFKEPRMNIVDRPQNTVQHSYSFYADSSACSSPNTQYSQQSKGDVKMLWVNQAQSLNWSQSTSMNELPPADVERNNFGAKPVMLKSMKHAHCVGQHESAANSTKYVEAIEADVQPQSSSQDQQDSAKQIWVKCIKMFNCGNHKSNNRQLEVEEEHASCMKPTSSQSALQSWPGGLPSDDDDVYVPECVKFSRRLEGVTQRIHHQLTLKDILRLPVEEALAASQATAALTRAEYMAAHTNSFWQARMDWQQVHKRKEQLRQSVDALLAVQDNFMQNGPHKPENNVQKCELPQEHEAAGDATEMNALKEQKQERPERSSKCNIMCSPLVKRHLSMENNESQPKPQPQPKPLKPPKPPKPLKPHTRSSSVDNVGERKRSELPSQRLTQPASPTDSSEPPCSSGKSCNRIPEQATAKHLEQHLRTVSLDAGSSSCRESSQEPKYSLVGKYCTVSRAYVMQERQSNHKQQQQQQQQQTTHRLRCDEMLQLPLQLAPMPCKAFRVGQPQRYSQQQKAYHEHVCGQWKYELNLHASPSETAVRKLREQPRQTLKDKLQQTFQDMSPPQTQRKSPPKRQLAKTKHYVTYSIVTGRKRRYYHQRIRSQGLRQAILRHCSKLRHMLLQQLTRPGMLKIFKHILADPLLSCGSPKLVRRLLLAENTLMERKLSRARACLVDNERYEQQLKQDMLQCAITMVKRLEHNVNDAESDSWQDISDSDNSSAQLTGQTERSSFIVLDCQVSDWGAWSECDTSCGTGMMTRQRQVLQAAQNGGKHCPSLTQKRGCQGYRCHGHHDKKILREMALLLPAALSHSRHVNDSSDIRRNLRTRYRDSYKHNRDHEYCVEFEVIKSSKACHKLPPYNLMLEGDRITVRCDLEALIQDSVAVKPGNGAAASTTGTSTTTTSSTTHRALLDGDEEDAAGDSNEDEGNSNGNNRDDDEEDADDDDAQNMLDTDSNESFEYKRQKQRQSGTWHHQHQLAGTVKRSVATPLPPPQPLSYHCRGEGLAGRTTRWSALPAPSCRGKWLRLTVGPPKKCNHAQFIFV